MCQGENVIIENSRMSYKLFGEFSTQINFIIMQLVES